MTTERERLEIEASIVSYTMKDGVPQCKPAFPLSRIKLSFVSLGEAMVNAANSFRPFVQAVQIHGS